MSELKPSCTKRRVEVTPQDLPLCCPQPDQALWNAHPRVYLPIEETGQCECPYCATEFTLTHAASSEN